MSNRLQYQFKRLDWNNEPYAALLPGARFLLMLYCEMADDRSLEAWPSTGLLVKISGMAERSVQRHVEDLRAAKLLHLVEAGRGRPKGAKYRGNLYRVTLGVTPVAEGEIPPEAKQQLEEQGLL